MSNEPLSSDEIPESADSALWLLVNASRVSPPLRKAVATVEDELRRLRQRADLLDLLHDEAFPDEPYLLGRLRSEIERLESL